MGPAVLLSLVLAASSPAPLEAARGAYAQAQATQQRAETEASRQQKALDALDAQIAERKVRQARQPTLFVPGELEQLLAQSQAQAEALARARRESAAAGEQLERARDALYRALGAEIEAEQGALGSTSEPSAVAALRQLQAEQARVAPQMATVPAAEPRFHGVSDDPRELRERADALRDQADKLARQEAAVAQRIQAVRDQARLERRLRRLKGEDALFDESDRRISLSRAGTPSVATDKTPTTTPATSGGPPVGPQTTTLNGPGNPAPGSESSPGSTARSDSPGAPQPPGASEFARRGEPARPDDLGRTGEALGDDESALPGLLAAQKRLAEQRAALEAQAKALEAQAGKR